MIGSRQLNDSGQPGEVDIDDGKERRTWRETRKAGTVADP